MIQNNKFFPIIRRIRPELNDIEGETLVVNFLETLLAMWVTPFAVIGLIWLVAVTDLTDIRDNLIPLLILLVALLVTERQPFSISIELAGGMNVGPTSSLASLISWSAVLIFGPVALWMTFITALLGNIRLAYRLRRTEFNSFWGSWSIFAQDTASILGFLIALWAYRVAGGSFPIEGLTADLLFPILIATLLLSFFPFVFLMPPTLQFGRIMGNSGIPAGFWLGVIVFTLVPAPFALLGAILFAQAGWAAFFFFILSVMLVNFLAHHLSKAQRRSQRQSRELAHLEALGEALLEAPSDASTLPAILENRLSALFPQERLEIRLFEEAGDLGLPVFHQVHPPSLKPFSPDIWARLRQSVDPYFIEKHPAHTNPDLSYRELIGVKIVISQTGEEGDTEQCLGGIYFARRELSGPVAPSLPTIQTLASQIGTALLRAQVHAETLAQQKMTQELAFAGKIQASFLPKEIPQLAGWQIAAMIEPARQTSGDFYDFIPLAEGKLGILVADVADKGTGAALYMALSRTLIRTYAMTNGDRPELALLQANERILSDAESDQFVTVFYGVLDWENGRLTYANAGHNPAYLLRHNGNGETAEKPTALIRTGIPLGMFPDMVWERAEVDINPGDLLFVYSDGVTEAQNRAGELFEDARLLGIGQGRNGHSAEEIQTAVLDAIHTFVGDAPQFDDITLMVVTRDGETMNGNE